MRASYSPPAPVGPRLYFIPCLQAGWQTWSWEAEGHKSQTRDARPEIYSLFLICQQQHDSKMKNKSVSYFFTQRDRKTDPSTAAAVTIAETAQQGTGTHWDTLGGYAGAWLRGRLLPCLPPLPAQPMLHLPSPQLSLGHFFIELTATFGEARGNSMNAAMTQPKGLVFGSKQPHNPVHLLHCQEKGIHSIFWWSV